jgi:hypothetical protein
MRQRTTITPCRSSSASQPIQVSVGSGWVLIWI